jgi:hypothetical protein
MFHLIGGNPSEIPPGRVDSGYQLYNSFLPYTIQYTSYIIYRVITDIINFEL